MKRSACNHAMLPRLLIGLLLATLAMQWTGNAVGMGSGRAAVAWTVQADTAADQVLADLATSVCSKNKADGGQAKVVHCQHCVPATSLLFVPPEAGSVSRLALALPIDPAFRSQILPPSRRQPGDGPSRAPPSFA